MRITMMIITLTPKKPRPILAPSAMPLRTATFGAGRDSVGASPPATGVIGAPQCGHEAARFETCRPQSGQSCNLVVDESVGRGVLTVLGLEGFGTSSIILHEGHLTHAPASQSSTTTCCPHLVQLNRMSMLPLSHPTAGRDAPARLQN